MNGNGAMTDTDRLRVLIVEDEALIAMMAEDMIEELGADAVLTAGSVAEAETAIAAGGFDFAILDVNLNGDNSMSLATLLKARGVPFAFTTGYGAGGVEEAHQDVPVLTKPYTIEELGGALARGRATIRDQAPAAGTSSMMSSVDSNLG